MSNEDEMIIGYEVHDTYITYQNNRYKRREYLEVNMTRWLKNVVNDDISDWEVLSPEKANELEQIFQDKSEVQ